MNRLDRRSGELMHDLCNLADTMLNGLTALRSSSTQLFARRTYLAFFVRVLRIFRAFAYLGGKGFGPEAKLLIRPFFDTVVDWLYIETSPERLGERYVMYQDASQLQRARDEGRAVDEQRCIAEHGDAIERFCNQYCKGRKKLPGEWSGLTAKQKRLKAGLTDYFPLYRDLSAVLHNAPLSLGLYIHCSDPKTLGLNTGPDFTGLDSTIALMCLGFILCLEKADEQFELHSKSEIEALGEQVRRYAKV